MTTGEHLRIERAEGAGIIRLGRPDGLNLLDTPFLEAIRDAVSALEGDDATRVIIITGNRHFSAGADIKEMKGKDPGQAAAFSGLGQAVCSAMERSSKPFIAAVRGYALGGGCELALACDVRITAEDGVWGLPETGLGLIPGFGGTQRLPSAAGPARAKELIFTGRLVNAGEALQIGLAQKMVKTEELMDSAIEMAAAMAAKGPLALREAKRLINSWIGRDYDMERSSFADCFGTEDRIEGIRAFIEKRRPKFKGR